jgi:hypothetical protein
VADVPAKAAAAAGDFGAVVAATAGTCVGLWELSMDGFKGKNTGKPMLLDIFCPLAVGGFCVMIPSILGNFV